MDSVERTTGSQTINPKMFVERRADQRFAVRIGAFASPSFTVVGNIMNVSHRGLAFRYVASKKRSKESSRLNISLNDHTFNLGKVPFKVVWDVAMPESYSHGAISLRLCGVKFGDLEDYQSFGLSYFIENYTISVGDP